MKTTFTQRFLTKKPITALFTGLLLFLGCCTATAQLGVYSFTGTGTCPHQNPAVNSQPANATFSNYVFAGGISCKSRSNEYETQDWANSSNTVNSAEYFGFTVTPASGYNLTLTQLAFNQRYDKDPASGVTKWVLRSSLDNFTTDIAVDTVTTTMQTDVINLPAGNFTNIGAVTFRFYLLNVNSSTFVNWRNDEVTLTGTVSSSALPQLGLYPFTGGGACPNQNPAVTTQPANALFTDYTAANTDCRNYDNVFSSRGWNTGNTIDLTQYNQFTITANPGYKLTLGSMVFTESVNEAPTTGSTNWYLRSSLDNYAVNLASGTATLASQTPSITLPAGSFTNIGAVTFRLYLTNSNQYNTEWTNDAVTVNGKVTVSIPADPANPTSNSPQCIAAGVTMNFNGTPPVGETWYWQTTAGGTSTANSASSYTVTTSGTYYLRSQDNTTLNWSSGAGFTSVTIVTAVGTPVFTNGPTSTRCQAAVTVNYASGAANNTGIVYSLDGASTTAGNAIDAATGIVTYTGAWSGVSTITATASGCSGPSVASHTATTLAIADQTITASPDSICSNTASSIIAASSQIGINYTLRDNSNNNIIAGPVAGSGAALNFATGNLSANKTFNVLAELPATTGALTFDGVDDYVKILDAPNLNPATITLECWVKLTAYQTWAPLILKADPTTWYNGYGLSMNNAGNKFSFFVNSYPNGFVTSTTTAALNTWYHVAATYDGTTTKIYVNGVLEASANFTGANYATANPLTLGGSVSGTVWQLKGSMDEARIWNTARTAAQIQNNINNTLTGAESGLVAYYTFEDAAGSSILTDIAGGDNNGTLTNMNVSSAWSIRSTTQCSLQMSTTPTVTIRGAVATPVFTGGSTSARCQGAGTVSFPCTAANSTSIAYTLDAASVAAGNYIANGTIPDVTYVAGWSGVTIITANAQGCNGPKTATHSDTTKATVGTPVFTSGATSTRCQGAGSVTYAATASNSTTRTYNLDATTAAFAGNSINTSTGAVTYAASWSGTTVITVTATGCNGPATATHTVTITPSVGTPVFTLGATSTRCQGSGTVNYAVSSTNSTAITYTLDGLSSIFNSINSSTGDVTFSALWTGTSTITASAAGCNGSKTATHTVTNTSTIGNVSFTSGSTSTRCVGAGTVNYTANSSGNTGITYTLDATSTTAGNSIDASTGAVTYVAGWVGASTITATATGCNGPKMANHVATTNDNVTTPVFAAGATSTRCQGAGSVSYAASASNATGITYSLDATTNAFAGNSINTSTGTVTYAAGWSGPSTITASAAGCTGPKTATHSVTTTPTVGTPVFVLGASSIRCQAADTLTYTANATNNQGITYTLDATTAAFSGNIFDNATGKVIYAAGWSGNSTITASATGCNGPKTATHTVVTRAPVGTPVFTLGATSTRCQGSGTGTYIATATASTSITYALDATTDAFPGNSININSGVVTYAAGWSGVSIITATASGCYGPTTADHTVTVTPTVGTPVFALGANSTICQASGTVRYQASSSNSTGITYSLSGAGSSTINSSTGDVSWSASFTGNATITASATGCNGPKTATHTVTVTPTVGNPSFSMGSTSTRCQGGNSVTYLASATNSVLSWALDAASLAGNCTIVSTTGAVTFAATWNGISTITVTATGCNGPKTANHTVTIIPTVSAPVFDSGSVSTRCQAGGLVPYKATASNSTSITYSLDAASAVTNSINSTTGTVAYAATWTGTTIITARAAGCNGPVSSTHTVTITPTVGTPSFSGGATSIRCQGAGNVTYTANATNTTGITYTIDGASITGGNAIGLNSGVLTYSPTWSGTTTITASAAGCSGPKTTTHTVTVTATVGTPVFVKGAQSTRTQSSGTDTYTANATQNTGITYTLDAASLAGGNTINTATGAVTWTSGWNGTSLITASASGCNGPSTSGHIVTINPAIVQAPLYLSGPGQFLDRIDPVSTNITTTLQTGDLSSAATTNVTFTQVPALCADLVIKAQTISALVYVSVTSGTMPTSPNITAQIKYGGTNIITLTNPIYNASTQFLTWSAILGADVTVPAGRAIVLQVTTAQPGVVFKILYHSTTKPSRISLFPVSTFIDITSFNVYNAPYPAGSVRVSGNPGNTMYARAVVTTPFGYTDITKLTINFNPPGSVVNVVCVDSTTCTRTYQYPWTIPTGYGNIALMATAYEGFENIIKNSEVVNFSTCLVCAPVTVADSAVGAGGSPITVDVLANDYDPNNNINRSTLSIFTQPNNGSGYVTNGKIVYLPNGTYAGRDTLIYQICDSTALCTTGQVFFTINPLFIDPCSEATKTHTFYIPYPESQAYTALKASASNGASIPSSNIRTIISLKMPYPGMTIVWDEWEDGYEENALNPTQSTTKVWGDGNPYNGIAPGYTDDIIPAGGSIVLDNTMPANPRVPANIFYDGRDKITSSGQISITQVSGEPTWLPVQSIKTNVTSVFNFGQSFTIPLGEDFPDQDFKYTALFIRASEDSTTVSIDKDNNGTFETTAILNEGQSLLVNGGVKVGATVTSDKPVGVELNSGGVDQYSIRNAPIYPATWYSNTYYTPVPTSDNAGDNPKDTSAVMFYNSLSRAIKINWTSGAPASGVINLPAKGVVRFPLAYSATAAYKFVNPTGEAFTAIEIVDSYTPGGGGNDGSTYDWAFNLIAEARLTDFATVAWAPGGLDLVAPPGPDVNGNPIWVTPTANTTVYVKYDGNVSGTTGLSSPCGLKYDISYPLNALNYLKIRDPNDNDQSGIAVYTCNGAKLAAVYGEDPQGSGTGIGVAYWDVGTTIQPFCKQKLIFANDDYGRTMVNQPVTIPVLLNDFGFLAVVDPATVNNAGLLKAKNGTIFINTNGTIIYTPNPGYVGKDTFEYAVCSTPSPTVCDNAKVYVDIAVCPAPYNQNVILGQVFLDKNEDGINNDGGTGFAGAKVYLYVDGNCNATIDANELTDSVIVDASGTYQFVTYPEKFVADDFDGPGGTNTCASGSDGNAAWKGNWTDIGDPSVGFCNNTQSAANTDVEIIKDGAFGYALRLKDKNRSATRTVNLTGASYAFLTFSYRRKSATLTAGKNVIVQASKDGSTFGTVFTIAGDGTTDANYVTIYNQDITQYAAATTYLRFLTNGSMADADTVYIDDVKIQFLKYPQCYITRLDPASVPAFHHTTTILQHSFTATSPQTCLSPYDFGIAKNKIVVSGSLFNDANGLTDNIVNGTGIGKVNGMTVYAYLVDTTGKVSYRTTLTVGGTFSFPAVDILTNFTLRLSTTSLNVGDGAPADVALPPGWLPTGDCYGINNSAGIGNSAVAPIVGIAVKTGTVNISGLNFGIERLPDSDDKSASYSANNPGMQYAIPGLTGSDPEDGLLGNGKTYMITSVPDNAVLFYNGALVSTNTVITNFNPALFLIDPSDIAHTSTFTYASRDAAGLYDPTPATVTINWNFTLPVKLISFTGRLNGTKVDLNWVTASEYNTKHFEVERSSDGQSFEKMTTVGARGNSSSATSYDLADTQPLKPITYYRLKIIDFDGKFEYSNIVIIRIENSVQLVTKVAPNPFTGRVDVYLTLTHSSNVDFVFFDISGRIVFKKTVKGLKGFNWFTINDLEKLQSAPYMLHIKTDDATIVEKLIKQ